MIKFFRKIRQQLFSKNRFSKYVLYAVGEIVLVVVGILIALSINNWNVDRKDRIKEQVVLLQLKEDYMINLVQLDEKIGMRDDVIKSALRLMKHIDAPTFLDQDSILYHLGKIGLWPTYDPINNDLINTGKLQLIQDEKLQRKLATWESDVLQLKEMEYVWKEYVMDARIFLKKHNIIRNKLNKFWEENMAEIYLLDKNKSNSVSIGKSSKPINYERVFNDPQLEMILSEAISTNSYNNLDSFALRNDILEILGLLNANVNQD